MSDETWATLVRHEGEAPREQSTCGWRDRLISREDDGRVAAWAHAVDIDGAREHYHRRSAELYYVLDGEGTFLLNGQELSMRSGDLLMAPSGVPHGVKNTGPQRLLVLAVLAPAP